MEFLLKRLNFRCVNETAKCNKVDDCGDFSDEEGCPCTDPDNMFRCSKGPCISKDQRCNFMPDCQGTFF